MGSVISGLTRKNPPKNQNQFDESILIRSFKTQHSAEDQNSTRGKDGRFVKEESVISKMKEVESRLKDIDMKFESIKTLMQENLQGPAPLKQNPEKFESTPRYRPRNASGKFISINKTQKAAKKFDNQDNGVKNIQKERKRQARIAKKKDKRVRNENAGRDFKIQKVIDGSAKNRISKKDCEYNFINVEEESPCKFHQY